MNIHIMGSNVCVRCLGREATLVCEKLYEKRWSALEPGQNGPDSMTDPASSVYYSHITRMTLPVIYTDIINRRGIVLRAPIGVFLGRPDFLLCILVYTFGVRKKVRTTRCSLYFSSLTY
jgi:hypothetical protein